MNAASPPIVRQNLLLGLFSHLSNLDPDIPLLSVEVPVVLMHVMQYCMM